MPCIKCGAELLSESAGSLCPVCLLDAAFADETDKGTAFHYDLIEEIARGGMGVVYRAVQHGSNRQVAIKMILVEQAATPGMMERFRAEAEAVASLDDPHILPIYEIGETEGRPFYSMKFANGGTLRECAADFSEPRDAARLVATIARAVHHAHDRGILHRDLKPGNVLLDGPERKPYVADFGLARWIGRESRLTLAQSALGTPHYIAPEQAEGSSRKLTPAADVYSLGAILYELLTDGPPFIADTPLETLRLSRETEPAPLRSLKPSVPRDLEVICLKCLAKEPTARYSSAAALADDLARWLEGRTILARPATALERGWSWARRNRALAGLSAAFAAALLLLVVFLRPSAVSRGPLAASPAPAKSVALLPFENLSRDPDNAYFIQGVEEEILGRLGKIADLKVISRTSTQRFKSARENLSDIGRQLAVANVIQGSVQKQGDQVRVRVQLINATNGAHLWADSYDYKSTDLFRVESEVAQTVAEKLQARLSGSEVHAIAVRPTQNSAAHQAYLKGRYFWNKTTADDLRKAIDYFTQSTAADPSYAPAYAGLADAYLMLPFITGGRPQECYPKAKEAARKALQLDDSLAEAHIAYAQAVQVYDFDYVQAAVEFQRGLELNPNYASGRWRHSWLLGALGKFDEAFAEMKRAVELDPLSLLINTDLAYLYIVTGRYDEAIEQLRRTLEIDPNYYYARGNLGEALEFKGEREAALAEWLKMRELNDDPFGLAEIAHVQAALGRKAEATRTLNEMIELAKTRYVQAYAFSLVYAALGQKDEALRWLEKSYEDRAGADLAFIRVDPFLIPLRGEPRFEALADKIVPRPNSSVALPPEKSIAVLPFLDLSQAKDQEYFCDGMSEAILDSLAQIKDLQVAARTSSFSFKGTNLGVKEIAAKLGVRHVLEGSLRRDGDRIRITVQLIKATDGFHIWSKTYERQLQGVFGVQDEITQAVTAALKLKLVDSRPARSENTEAYELYLQGVFFSNKSSEEGLRKSLDFFQRSIEKDPTSARPWVGIAKVWNWLADLYVRPMEAYPKMKAAAEKAVALDPDNGEAHMWMGEAKRIFDWDLPGFKVELDRALQLDPNSATAHIFMALYWLTHGDKEKGVAYARESIRLDPLSPIVSNFAAMAYMSADRVDDALVEAKRTAEIDPTYIYQGPLLANIYREKGMFPEAIALFLKAREITGLPQPGLAITYAKTGREQEARLILAELLEIAEKKYMAGEEIASVYVALGEKEEAYKWLERACDDHGGAIHAVPIRPVFKALHSEPRFHALMRRIGLDPSLLFDRAAPL
ncbi:MAG TPA: protein kinase [Chthoniobacterales bacterium]|jgi:TolB-like protein/Tfp pilus assembly protein PilF/predicted Ser/Thr protein kinase|nr:protein kinase [Chthoniobacterales bacterium]